MRLLKQRHERSKLDQRGFALMAVLAVIALTAVTIGALFTLLYTTMRVTATQERSAREARSADGAIEAAINQMRTEPCTGVSYTVGELYDQGTPATGDDVSVDVECKSATGSQGSSDQVRIVGTDGYQGTAIQWKKDCSVGIVVGCFPWQAAGTAPSLDGSTVSMLHTGHEALEFSSGVTVKAGAAALRNPTAGSPAMEIGGQYIQGDRGLLSATPTGCGLLSGDPGAGAGRIVDSDDAPGCGVAAAAAVDSNPTGSVAGLIASSATPAVPACGTGPVVTFLPGTYNAARTAQVSALTGGTCKNKTFHFTPGIYAFEGKELAFGDPGSYYVFGAPSTWTTAAGIQGDPATRNLADAQLCNPEASGTSIVISGWTKLTHTAGRVAMCPNTPVDPADATKFLDAHPAIFQSTAAPTTVAAVIDPLTNSTRNRIGVPFKCRVNTAFGSDYPANSDYPNGVNQTCRPLRTYNLKLTTDGGAPVDSLRVLLTGTENTNTPNNLISNRQTRFTVFNAGGSSVCSTGWATGTPNGDLTSSFDVKTMPAPPSGASCATTSFDQTALNGGRIKVDHRMDLALATIEQQLTVSKAQVEVNAFSGVGATASSGDWANPTGVLAAGGGEATPNMPCGDFVCPVADPTRSITPNDRFVHEVRVEDFDFPGLLSATADGLDPSLTTLRAVVRVTPSNTNLPAAWTSAFGNLIDVDNFMPETYTFITLTSPDGKRCVTQGSGMNTDQEISFDLLSSDYITNDVTCSSFLFEHASQLEDVTLDVRFELPCVRDYLNNRTNMCLRAFLENPTSSPALPVWQVRPPDIDQIRLTTVTNTYAGKAQTSRITSNATDGAAGSSFNVYGKTWMPLSDLDIFWDGPATAASMFSADLVLHGMASTMKPGAAMGIVCCSPPDVRTVDITALIDGVDRLVVTAEFIDVYQDPSGNEVYSPGYAVNILDYQACGRSGCASVLGQTEINGP